jgi:acetyl esterase
VHFDPELMDLVNSLGPPSDFSDVATARQMINELFAAPGDPDDRVEVTERAIPGPSGAPEVRVIVHEFRGRSRPCPAVVYIHGGGFAVGTPEGEGAGASAAAVAVEGVVVSVDYRLAPEHPYPAGLEDCYAALVWLAGEAEDLGLDRSRIAVAGGSAGGGLSAGLALLARDRGGPALCFQYLGIPELDDRLDTPSMRAFTDTPMWNRPSAVRSWAYYLGESPAEVPPYAAPARATDLAGLPPAYISVCEYDPLRDEGIAYAQALLGAGVSVELHLFPGTFHGSSLVAEAAISRRMNSETSVVLRRALRGSEK